MEDKFIKIKWALCNFHPLKEDEWEIFSASLIVKTLFKGDYLIEGGHTENFIYFINQGCSRSFFVMDGKDFTVDFHFKNEFVTAYYSLITREPSTISIELLEDTEVVVIPLKFLNRFYESSHNGETIGRLMAEQQYVKRLGKEMDLLSKTAEQRYAELLDKNPKLIHQLSVKHLSSYLGIQPESLSRIRKMKRRF